MPFPPEGVSVLKTEPASITDYHLTRRELDVARLLCQGLSNKEIGHALVLEITTVRSHVARILTKTHSQNRTQAAFALVRQLGPA